MSVGMWLDRKSPICGIRQRNMHLGSSRDRNATGPRNYSENSGFDLQDGDLSIANPIQIALAPLVGNLYDFNSKLC